jgi:hypothetical protein
VRPPGHHAEAGTSTGTERSIRWRTTTGNDASGCGGDDTPEACANLEDVSADELQSLDLTSGEGTIADVEASLETIRADLQTAASEAEAELSEPIAALESSLGGLSTEFDTANADDDLSADEAAGLLDSLAAVSTSWEALMVAAPDCEL